MASNSVFHCLSSMNAASTCFSLSESAGFMNSRVESTRGTPVKIEPGCASERASAREGVSESYERDSVGVRLHEAGCEVVGSALA